MSKRSLILVILLMLTAFASSAVMAQAPFVSITNPANNSVLNINSVVPVTVSYGNLPEGGSLLLRAYNDAETQVFAQDQTIPSLIPWQANLDFSGSGVTPGTTGHLTASVIDQGGNIVAQGGINVTYGTAAPPPATATPTATPTATTIPPSATPTATPTTIVPGSAITITSPTNGSTVNITTPITVSGTTSPVPVPGGSTVIVRLLNGSGSTLGEQGVVPNADGTFSVQVSATAPGSVERGTGGSVIAFLQQGSSVLATSNQVSLIWSGVTPVTPQPSLQITSPTNGATVNLSTPVAVSGTSAGLPGAATIVVYAYVNGNSSPVGQQTATRLVNGTFTASISFSTPVANNTPGTLVAYVYYGSGILATSNTVSVTWTTTAVPTLNITQPNNGATVDITRLVRISGTSSHLPTGQVTVRVSRSDGSTIIETTTNVNNAGNWRVDVPVAVPPGTPGIIYAFARDNASNIVAQKSINVTFGFNQNAPVVVVTNPLQGQVVGVGTPIQVNGYAFNVFENAIVVRALDTFGNTLAQQPVVTDPNGNFVTSLTVNVPAGTPGSIYAFATSPQNGAIVASSRVGVYFGGQCFIRTDWPVYVVKAGDTLLRIAQATGSTVTELAFGNCITNANLVYTGQQLRVPRLPAPTAVPQSTLRIVSPQDNSVVNADQRVTVTGAGRNLNGNDVIVRALDQDGNLLAQQTVRVGAPDNSGESVWQVSLSINVPDGTRGALYAFAQSTSGQILADALVNVTYNSTIVVTPVPGGNQKLTIVTPNEGDMINPAGQVQVTGQILGPFTDDIYVRALDAQGSVLAEILATLSPADNQGNFTWEAFLDLNVPPGTRGIIYAYVPQPFSAGALIADAVNVIYGQPDNGAYVTITDPLPYGIVNIDDPFTVTGMGGRLFEGNVVVRALDDEGQVLAETATTINSPDAGTGGEGEWQANLRVNVAEGTRGSLVAFSTSARDGSISAFASIPVIFGDVTNTANFVQINAPLPGTVVDAAQTLMIAGTADGQTGTEVRVQILDDQGNVLVDQPRNLNPAVEGDYSVWQMLIQLRGIAPGTHLQIMALTASRFDGTTLASDTVDVVVGESGAQS